MYNFYNIDLIRIVSFFTNKHNDPPKIIKNELDPLKNNEKEILKITSNHQESFAARSKKFLDVVARGTPQAYQKLQELHAKYPGKLEVVKTLGWHGLKKTLKEGMAQPDNYDLPPDCGQHKELLKNAMQEEGSYETFRKEIVDGVIDFEHQVLVSMGYENPGCHSAFGNPGWDSDIDTPFLANEDVPDRVQMLEKLMFDMIFFAEFGGLPGDLFDAESYKEHSATAFDTSTRLETPLGQEGFAKTETFGSVLQMLIGCGGNPQNITWQQYKIQHLKAAEGQDMTYHRALEKIFDEAEIFNKQVSEEIEKTLIQESGQEVPNDPHERSALSQRICFQNSTAKKYAKMSYKMDKCLQFSQAIDCCKEEIAKIDKEILMAPSASNTRNQRIHEENLKRLQEKRDSFQVRIAALSLLEHIFFDEAYLTQGSYKSVCSKLESQIHKRSVEGFQNRHQNLLIGREEQLDGTALHRALSKPLQLNEEQQIEPSPQEASSTMLENFGMYLKKFHEKSGNGELQELQKALIDTSKYGARVIGKGVLQLLKELESKKDELRTDSNFNRLKNSAQEIQRAVGNLEKVKRRKTLNIYTAKKALMEEITKMKPLEDIPALSKNLDQMLQLIDRFDDEDFEESILPENKFAMFMSYLTSHDYINKVSYDDEARNEKSMLPLCESNEVNAILKGLSGIRDIGSRFLLDFYDRAAPITLEALDLTSEEAIMNFNEKLQEIVIDVDALCKKHEINVIPQSNEGDGIDFNALLRNPFPSKYSPR